jgi:hypothetical protein
MMHRFLLTGWLLIIPLFVLSQNTSHRAFQPGERVEYKAFYNWGFIWIHAGNVSFEVEKATYNNQPSYKLEAYGKSLKSYDWAFKVRDRFTTHVQPQTLKPLHFVRDTYEGGYAVNNEYTFNYQTNRIYSQTQNSKEPYQEDTLAFDGRTLDVLSAIYHARNLDFSQYAIDEKIPLTMVIDNAIYELFLRYQGEEEIRIPGGERYNCIKFSAMLVEGTIFSGGEHLTVWVTRDKNRVPVMVRAKILVGSVKAVIQSTHRLKHPSVLTAPR